uniref:Guanylate cyclase activator 2B n=1 Tax=Bubo bubo TaxID=30461 RepID=A0A8C0FSX9_BUBBB
MNRCYLTNLLTTCWSLNQFLGELTDGDLKFSLESVKKLKELMDENRHIHHRMVVPMSSYSPCHEKDLPEEFQSVCKREDASMIFERLTPLQENSCCAELSCSPYRSGCCNLEKSSFK